MDNTVFTPASVLSLLLNMSELSEYDIGLSETIDNKLMLTVGDSVYMIEPEGEVSIEVSESDADAVENVNLETYQDLEDEGLLDLVEENEYVESGLIKEAAKAMLLGGMIKLSAKLLKG